MRNAEFGLRNEKRKKDGRMRGDDLKKRTRSFALRVIRIAEALPKRRTAEVIGRQLIRSGTSVGTNYRAACWAKSPVGFISKMGIVEEEMDNPYSGWNSL
jgi:hypothetical protein